MTWKQVLLLVWRIHSCVCSISFVSVVWECASQPFPASQNSQKCWHRTSLQWHGTSVSDIVEWMTCVETEWVRGDSVRQKINIAKSWNTDRYRYRLGLLSPAKQLNWISFPSPQPFFVKTVDKAKKTMHYLSLGSFFFFFFKLVKQGLEHPCWDILVLAGWLTALCVTISGWKWPVVLVAMSSFCSALFIQGRQLKTPRF